MAELVRYGIASIRSPDQCSRPGLFFSRLSFRPLSRRQRGRPWKLGTVRRRRSLVRDLRRLAHDPEQNNNGDGLDASDLAPTPVLTAWVPTVPGTEHAIAGSPTAGTVLVLREELRATGDFLSVQRPAGIVVLIVGWMLDPVSCAGMTIGAPRVDLAALIGWSGY